MSVFCRTYGGGTDLEQDYSREELRGFPALDKSKYVSGKRPTRDGGQPTLFVNGVGDVTVRRLVHAKYTSRYAACGITIWVAITAIKSLLKDSRLPAGSENYIDE